MELIWNVHVLDETKTEYGEIYMDINGSKITELNFTFANCTSLIKSPPIPEGVVVLHGTYWDCEQLSEFPNIPQGVLELPAVFVGCGSLTDASNFVIPSSVEVASNLFSSCWSLEIAPLIPATVTNIVGMFDGCPKLKTYVGSEDADGDFSNYVLPNGITSVAELFAACDSITVAPVIPDGVTNMYRTFNGSGIISSPIIPDGVTDLRYTFSKCYSLTTALVIPAGVTDMSGTFYDCTSLTGTIQINTDKIINNDENVYDVTNNGYNCFYGTNKPIVLKGTGTTENIATLELLAGTANNSNVTIE